MFTPTRLTVARQRRGFTRKELAEKIGLQPRAITGFEGGEYEPTAGNVESMAHALGFAPSFFQGEEMELADLDGVSFRSMSKMSARQRDAAVAAAALAFSVSKWIDKRFDFPQPSLPDLRAESPDVAASYLRQYWGIGEKPIKNLVHLLELKGVRVFSLAEYSREVDAYSFWKDGRPFIFLNTIKSAERRRFDAAHELGHIVLHKHAAPNGIEAEKDANAFAGAFLLPEASLKALGRVPPSFDRLIEIKKEWRVSLSALVYRLNELGLIRSWHYRTLYIEMQRRGYVEKEPAEGKAETSQVWQKVFRMMREDGQSVENLADDLKIPSDEVAKLMFGLVTVGLPSNPMIGAPPRGRAELRLIPKENENS